MTRVAGPRYTFRNYIRYHMVNREIEMTRKELAEKTGLDPSCLDGLISGKSPSPSALEALIISRALGEKVEDVFILVDSRVG